MDEKVKEIVDQYDLEVKNVYRVRGAYMLDTAKGLYIMREFRSNEQKAELAQQVKESLIEKGYEYVDVYERNKEEKLIAENSMGNQYVIKRWFIGEECNLKQPEDVARAAKNLARLHLLMRNATKEPSIFQADTYGETLIRHNRELRRVRTYIKDKKQRNEFELMFLSVFSEFYQEAEQAESMLADLSGNALYEELEKEQTLCHGSYNYHNLILLPADVATTNFEHVHLQLQCMDLYDLLRKLMEKNNWNITLFATAMEHYENVRPLSKEEKYLLYLLLVYPEKFWKITNFYYNSKKTWMSGKNIEKLQGLQQQKNQRRIFLDKVPRMLGIL